MKYEADEILKEICYKFDVIYIFKYIKFTVWQTDFITSAKKDMFSLCLLATAHKTTDKIFMKVLPEKYSWTRKSPLNFGVIWI